MIFPSPLGPASSPSQCLPFLNPLKHKSLEFGLESLQNSSQWCLITLLIYLGLFSIYKPTNDTSEHWCGGQNIGVRPRTLVCGPGTLFQHLSPTLVGHVYMLAHGPILGNFCPKPLDLSVPTGTKFGPFRHYLAHLKIRMFKPVRLNSKFGLF